MVEAQEEGWLKTADPPKLCFQRLVWIHIWEKEGMSSSCHYLSDRASYFLHGFISNVAKKTQNTDIFPKVTRNSRTCDFNFCWLFICTYCIYKVQSLLLPNPHFQHHIIHSDELGLSQTAAYDPARSLGSVTQLPSTNCCVMLSMERRDFGSDLRKVCQDATSYRAFHLTAAETLPFVIGDDSRCSNTDTISWDLSQLGKIAKYTRRKAFVKLDFQAILTFSYTLYHVTLSFF